MAKKDTVIAIAGNPNSGKTTAFNKYTGARQHVGNYPGITVEKKEGMTHIDGKDVHLVDLPGTYSLTAYSLEEVVARNFLVDERPKCVLNILNTAVLERNLYLTVQLLELGIPVVLALNMMDEAKAQGIHIDTRRLEELMGIKAIPTVAKTGQGLDDALRAAMEVCENPTGKVWQPLEISYGTDIDVALQEMMVHIEKNNILMDRYPSRWVALKIMENDSDIINQVRSVSADTFTLLKNITDAVAKHLDMTQNTYPEAIIAEYRYGYITAILKKGILSNPNALHERIAYSDKIDTIVTHKLFGPLIMLGLLYFMYWITFSVGAYPQGWVEDGFAALEGVVNNTMPDGLLRSLITSGIIAGVGGVFSFVPLIAIMFLFIAFLEDLGYMARLAYMWDKIFRFFGLHGASVMPFIISGGIAGGCAVPGVMATRTLRSPRERLATMLTAPFMACGAKLPVFLLFVGIFFPAHKEIVMFSLTLAGWIAALLVARLLRSTLIKGASTPFVMELPPYRLPTLLGVLLHTWERAWMYIKKAGTIILAIAIILWATMTFPALPEAETKLFADQKMPIEKQLEMLPYGQLKKAFAEINTQLEETAKATPEHKSLAEQHQFIKQMLDETPYSSLKATLEEKQDRLEKYGENTEVEDLSEQLAALEKELEAANNSIEKTVPVLAAIAKVKESLVSSAPGRLTLEITTLKAQLEAMPEKIIEDKITEIDNAESSAALRHSLAGRIGTALEVVSRPAGFDWKTNIALVGGIAAKEVVVSTLGTAYSLGGDVDPEGDDNLANLIKHDPLWSKANATALLLFSLLYSPCFVTVVMIKQESGKWRWAIFSVVFNLLLAYTVAVIANQFILAL